MQKFFITNSRNQKICTVLEGNLESNKILVFVHGFGSGKDEGDNLFLDISKELQENFKIIRFDFTGYGKSDGKQEEADYSRHAEDLNSVLNYIKKEFHNAEINIIAHSMGTFITAFLSPNNIKQVIFTSPPNANTESIIQRFKYRVLSKGGTLDENGVSVYPRSNGQVQKVGKNFWKYIKEFKPTDSFQQLANKTILTILKPLQDEIVGKGSSEDFSSLKNVNIIKINGTHNFRDKLDRESLIVVIKEILFKN